MSCVYFNWFFLCLLFVDAHEWFPLAGLWCLKSTQTHANYEKKIAAVLEASTYLCECDEWKIYKCNISFKYIDFSFCWWWIYIHWILPGFSFARLLIHHFNFFSCFALRSSLVLPYGLDCLTDVLTIWKLQMKNWISKAAI